VALFIALPDFDFCVRGKKPAGVGRRRAFDSLDLSGLD